MSKATLIKPQFPAGEETEAETRRQLVVLLPRLRRFARGLTGSAPAGDDLLQATCERALANLGQWTPGSRLDSWLFRIARNLYLNELRAGRVRQSYVVEAQQISPGSLCGERRAETGLRLARLRLLLARLPEEQRSAILLIAVEGMSYAEAAEALTLPVGTVTSRLARARQTLRDWMGEDAFFAEEADRPAQEEDPARGERETR